MTKKENFVAINAILNEMGNSDFDEFIAHEIALLEKRNASKTSKPSKNQIANEGIKARIADVLAEVEEPVTVTEIIGLMGENFNNQKISALLRQMGNVKKEYVKGKAVFSLA